MRTTLDIDADVLEAAKEISERAKTTPGQVISDLARKALNSSGPAPGAKPTFVNGFEIIPAGGRIVTPEMVEKLLEESEAP